MLRLLILASAVRSSLGFQSPVDRSVRRVSVYKSATSASNTFQERVESLKSGAIAAVSGSLAFAPYAVVQGLIEPQSFSAQWEFSHDMYPNPLLIKL